MKLLYLFGSGAWKNDRKILKIGYTSDFDNRKTPYYLYNPLGEMLDTREGDELDELRIHLRLVDFKVEFLDEWFHAEDEVFRVFKEETYKDMNNWLWEHKSETLLYPEMPLPGTMKRELLDQIRKEKGINVVDAQKLLSTPIDLDFLD